MVELTILSKYKEKLKNKSIKDSFIDIFTEIEKQYLDTGEIIRDEKVKEIIEFGDYIFNQDNTFTISSEKFQIFKDFYSELKRIYGASETFKDDCYDLLDDLKVDEVREIESLYKLFCQIKLDKEVKIFFKTGLVFNGSFKVENESDMELVLEFKSYIAKALRDEAVLILDFMDYDKNTVITAGFVFEEGISYALKQSYLKENHSRNDYKQSFIVANL